MILDKLYDIMMKLLNMILDKLYDIMMKLLNMILDELYDIMMKLLNMILDELYDIILRSERKRKSTVRLQIAIMTSLSDYSPVHVSCLYLICIWK